MLFRRVADSVPGADEHHAARDAGGREVHAVVARHTGELRRALTMHLRRCPQSVDDVMSHGRTRQPLGLLLVKLASVVPRRSVGGLEDALLGPR